MKDTIKNNKEDKHEKEPIFIKRSDGLGWSFNFNRPVSYVILILFLAGVVVCCLFAAGTIKL